MNMMSFFRWPLRSVRSRGTARAQRIMVVGDSHASAFEHAVKFTEDDSDFKKIEVLRFAKVKGNLTIGNITFEKFLTLAEGLTEQDYIFSVIGGNQYAVFSTVYNPDEFDFLSDPRDRQISSDNAKMIPNRAMQSYLCNGLLNAVIKPLQEMTARTKATVVHLAPPAPKEDNEFISSHFEVRFSELGISELGPSRPNLRRKSWALQLRLLNQMCADIGIEVLNPPPQTITKAGYLDPYYYAKDVTHANRRYGREALKQILAFVAKRDTNKAVDAGAKEHVASR